MIKQLEEIIFCCDRCELIFKHKPYDVVSNKDNLFFENYFYRGTINRNFCMICSKDLGFEKEFLFHDEYQKKLVWVFPDNLKSKRKKIEKSLIEPPKDIVDIALYKKHLSFGYADAYKFLGADYFEKAHYALLMLGRAIDPEYMAIFEAKTPEEKKAQEQLVYRSAASYAKKALEEVVRHYLKKNNPNIYALTDSDKKKLKSHPIAYKMYHFIAIFLLTAEVNRVDIINDFLLKAIEIRPSWKKDAEPEFMLAQNSLFQGNIKLYKKYMAIVTEIDPDLEKRKALGIPPI